MIVCKIYDVICKSKRFFSHETTEKNANIFVNPFTNYDQRQMFTFTQADGLTY